MASICKADPVKIMRPLKPTQSSTQLQFLNEANIHSFQAWQCKNQWWYCHCFGLKNPYI